MDTPNPYVPTVPTNHLLSGRDLGGGVQSFANSTLIGRLAETILEALKACGVDDHWPSRVAENNVAQMIVELEVFGMNATEPLLFDDSIAFLRARLKGADE
jgi:hypothetical protein